MKSVWLDIETRATKNVVDYGVYAHAPTVTGILCIRYILGDDPTLHEWRGFFADGENADCADAPPADLIAAAEDPDVMFYAHNASYERVVLRDSPATTWWPDVPIKRWICTASWAAAFNLPRGLGPLSRYLLGTEAAKMVDAVKGVRYMWDATKPLISAADMDTQSEYCGRDTQAMKDCMACLPPVDPDWLEQYHASEAINDRGVFIDVELAQAVKNLKPSIDAALLARLDRVTGGDVKLRGPSFLKWLKKELPEDLQQAVVVNRKYRAGYSFKTKKVESSDKVARKQVLEAIEDRPGMAGVREAITVFDQANKASTSKFAAAIDRSIDDGLLCGQFIFNGAGQTKRFSSTGVQVHNLKRDVSKEAMEIIEDFIRYQHHRAVLEEQYQDLSTTASEVLRPLFVAADGRKLIWSDWSSIEARMLPWLSDNGEDVLRVFRTGKDIYLVQASLIFGEDIEPGDPRRQIGKVAVLSLGYQGGVGAFQSMAANYGLDVEDVFADEIKNKWRAANQWAVNFWADLEDAAMRAINNPLSMCPAGKVQYVFVPELLHGTLLCWLPSGAWLSYPKASIQEVEKFGNPAPGIVFDHPTYGPSTTYGGSLAENITQGEAATLLREKLVTCEAEGFDTVLHVHDEIIVEADEADVEATKADLVDIMEEVPAWAEGLPLSAEAAHGSRYKIRDTLEREA